MMGTGLMATPMAYGRMSPMTEPMLARPSSASVALTDVHRYHSRTGAPGPTGACCPIGRPDSPDCWSPVSTRHRR